ncbi:Fubp1, partial [Symbiodinium microadriaticum]
MLATAYFQSPPQESGARIEISKTETEGAKAGEPGRTVYISGLQDAVDKAKKLIDDAIEKACTLKVPHELIGMLIGRGGETIKDLKKESGARIDIAKEADEEGSTDRQVHITGPPECVEFAKKMIEDMLGKSRESREGKDGQRKPGGRVIKVPTDMIGVLIGRGGETISKIQRESSARIEIHKDDREALDRQVTITGSADNVEKAIRAIDDVLDGAERVSFQPALSVPEFFALMKFKDVERIVPSKFDVSGVPQTRAVARPKGPRLAQPPVILEAFRSLRGGDEGALVPLDRKPSPVRDSSWLSEKVYIDEVEMPYRPNYLPDHEDGMGTDLEIFVRGSAIKFEVSNGEILLLRRQKQSKGMAYVVFNRHDHAVIAKNKLQGTPASSIPCGGELQTEEKQSLYVRFSESERCINGRSNVYGADMAVLLQGPRGRAMQEVALDYASCDMDRDRSFGQSVVLGCMEREHCNLRVFCQFLQLDMRAYADVQKVEVLVAECGVQARGYGQVDEDPRMHLVAACPVYYDADGADDVVKAIEVWGKQLGEIHREIVERSKGKGKGKGWPWMPPPHYFDGRAPMMPHPYGPPPPHLMHHPPHMGPAPEPAVEAPVLLVRRKILEAEDGKPPELSKEKVIEATSLRGRELRWQPWPEVGKFNGDWKVTPLRWGLRGELFVLLRHRESGETRVCAAEAGILSAVQPAVIAGLAGDRYKSFTFNEHLFVISIDRESGILKVFHVPDPSSSWNVAFETTLPEDPSERQDFPLSRRAKLCIFYAMDRTPYAVAVEPKAEEGDRIASVFRIADPAKAWTLCAERPALPPKVRLLMVYTKARSPNPTEFEASLFAIDANAGEMKVFQVPSDMDKPWNQISSLPFAGDTRLSCIYVPGKPEPLLMAGSPTEKMQKLCHLNLMEWRMHKQ